MFRFAGLIVLGLALVSFTGLRADDKDTKKDGEVKLTGKVTCAKCDLGVEKKCASVIVVKGEKDAKDVIYYFDTAAHKAHHSETCTDPKEGTVTGTTSKMGDKMIVTVKSLEYKKK